MVDVVDQKTRSRMMAGIRGKNTRPEIFVRQFLHGQGLRFRLHARNLPGCPDIVLPKWRVAIFVHGCFWHRHERCRFNTIPVNNAERWQRKFDENVARDRRNALALVSAGWAVIILWECGLREAAAGKRGLLWLLDRIQDATLAGHVLQWPPTAQGKPQPGHGFAISALEERTL
jgi:DNA mismatch endonuclease (patch repair protein)